MTTALLDLDLIGFRCAISAENDPVEIAIIRTDRLVREILDKLQPDSYEGYLSGGKNFRKELFPLYKANRTKPDPIHLQAVREFLCTEWKSKVTDGIEADDALGIRQTELNPTSVIVSIDKDMLMIPGEHYNFIKDEFYYVSELDGFKHFYKQLLIGDAADNIKGVLGIGKVKASKLIDPCETEEEMFETVRELYADDRWLLLTGNLLYIHKVHNDKWQPQALKHLLIGQDLYRPEQEAELNSTQMMQKEICNCTGPTMQMES